MTVKLKPWMLPWLLLLVALLLAFSSLAAGALQGRVVGISDGDTLTLLVEDKRQVKIRLAEIDTPERAQPYGTRARQALSELAFGETVRVRIVTVDRYGRTVGRLMRERDGLDINEEMIRRGAAWVYRDYNRDKSLLSVEEKARASRRGLWALPEAERLPPWEWRSTMRRPSAPKETGTVRQAASTGASASCGAKRYCREMTSCEEARLYLHSCGLQTIDGDRDGIPCESLCR